MNRIYQNITQRFGTLHLIICFVILSAQVFAQNAAKMEQQLNSSHVRLETAVKYFDSLQTNYELKIREIDREKSRAAPDKEIITTMMASTILISNQIEAQKAKIDLLKIEIEAQKKQLDIEFTKIIDSLKTLEASNDFTGDKNMLNVEILSFIEKKILIGLKVLTLSYSPEKLLNITPAIPGESIDKILHEDYLQTAIAEVENEYESVSEFREEIEQVVRLRRKVSKFISDAEFESDLISFNFPSSRTEAASLDGTKYLNANEQTLLSNLASYTFILDKLIFQQNLDIRKNAELQLKFSSGQQEISLQDFIELLEEIESRLSKYKNMLEDKLSELNDGKDE